MRTLGLRWKDRMKSTEEDRQRMKIRRLGK